MKRIFLLITVFTLVIQTLTLEKAQADGVPSERKVSHDGVTFLIPANSLVNSPVPFGDKIVRGFTFSGRYSLSGTLHYGRYDVFSNTAPEELYFIPDQAVAKRLPYWWLSRPAEIITFSNKDEYIKRYIPPAIRKSVKERKPRHYSQRMTLLVEGLNVWVLCNSSNHQTKILKPLYFQPLKANKSQFEAIDC